MPTAKPLPYCGNGCGRKARTIRPGSYCMPCRNELGALGTDPYVPPPVTIRPKRRCKTDGCTSGLLRKDRDYCYQCLGTQKRESKPKCAEAVCRWRAVDARIYCRKHDIGLDLAAGDWFDQVAVDRAWTKNDPGRPLTVPEVRDLFARGEAHGMGYKRIADYLDLPREIVETWHTYVYRRPVVSEAA